MNRQISEFAAGTEDALQFDVNIERIDFISSYCDGWCERCAFTRRCSAFAVQAAIAMCGDVQEGFELAVGAPRPVATEPAPAPEWLADLDNNEMTPYERAEFDCQEKARDARIADTSIVKVSRTYGLLSHRWLTVRHEQVVAGPDVVLKEALEIALHDALLISAKLHRALTGRDRHNDDVEEDHPIQNDWNGSAKVALISLERSEAAWRTIAATTDDHMPTAFADQLRDLRREAGDAFPHAWSFVRPGFDEPGR